MTKGSIYSRVQRNIVGIMLGVSILPLVLLGGVINFQFTNVYKQKIEDQIRYRAESQAKAIEIFLKERTAILSTLVHTLPFDYLKDQKHLARIFEVIHGRTEGLVDVGIIDQNGNHLTYIGPYDLAGLNYAQQPWFDEVMSKGIYISDVYMGFRRLPHFVISVRGQYGGNRWALRATIDSDIFNSLVRTAQTGRSGDAYIVDKKGLFQTQPRFSGGILGQSDIDVKLFGEGGTVIERTEKDGRLRYYSGVRLKGGDWLLIISQEARAEMGGLLQTKQSAFIIIFLGCSAIVIATLFTTHSIIKRLENSERTKDELNSELMQADKMAALGRMAAGIAHEINNPLAVIAEKAGWMKDLLEEEEFQESKNSREYRLSLDKIEEHVGRASKITHNMLNFARRMEHRLDDVDVNQVLNQTIELLQNHARINAIEIIKKFQENLPIIASDQSQLQQVFLNLINNAIDAIEKDGRIEIITHLNNTHIAVQIKDDGPGIPPEFQRRIFDPFFTTKQTGKGTGLGLSISYRIIEKLGGSIAFDSTPGRGTTFTVKLPSVAPEKK